MDLNDLLSLSMMDDDDSGDGNNNDGNDEHSEYACGKVWEGKDLIYAITILEPNNFYENDFSISFCPRSYWEKTKAAYDNHLSIVSNGIHFSLLGFDEVMEAEYIFSPEVAKYVYNCAKEKKNINMDSFDEASKRDKRVPTAERIERAKKILAIMNVEHSVEFQTYLDSFQ